MKRIIAVIFFAGFCHHSFCIRHVAVTNVFELMDNIGSDTKIELSLGNYDLHTFALERYKGTDSIRYPFYTIYYGSVTSGYAGVERVDFQIRLHDVKNLTIAGWQINDSTSWITSPSDIYDVLQFEHCQNISLEQITFGHWPEPPVCAGDVLYFNKCSGIQLKNCTLFGSGLNGLTADDTDQLGMTGCTIRDCTENIMVMERCSNVRFSQCHFCRTPGQFFISFSYEQKNPIGFLFSGCYFENLPADNLFYIDSYDKPSVTLSNCNFPENELKNLNNNWKENIQITKSVFLGQMINNKAKKVKYTGE